MSLNNVIKLVVGDYSYDGHGQTDSIVIKSNLTNKEMVEAKVIGEKKINFKLDKFCKNHEDNVIPFKEFKKLIDAGLIKEMDWYESDEEEDLYADPAIFADIFLFLVKLGNEKFEYKISEADSVINIGGYGLYN